MEFHEAKKYLHDVPEGYEFHTANGFLLHNLRELRDILKIMPEEVFSHHVTAERNDFVNWIRDVIQDTVLAHHLSRVHSKEDAYAVVKKRIEELKVVIHEHYHEHMKKLEKKPTQGDAQAKAYGEKETKEEHRKEIPHKQHMQRKTYSDAYYKRKEHEMEVYYKHIIVKEFFYGMASGIILALILLRMMQLLR